MNKRFDKLNKKGIQDANISEDEDIDIKKINYSDFLKDAEEIEKEVEREEAGKRHKGFIKANTDPFNHNESTNTKRNSATEKIKNKINEKKVKSVEIIEDINKDEGFNKDFTIFNEEIENKIEINENEIKKYKNIKKKITFSAIGVVVVLVVYLYIGFGYYNNKFLPSTVINGVDCSGKTVEQVSEIMREKIENYHLSIVNNDIMVDELNGSDINLNFGDFDVVLNEICQNQQKTSWLKGFIVDSEPISTGKGLTYDTLILNQFIDSSLILGMTSTVKSVNAGIEYKEGEFIIIPAVYGDEIDQSAFINKIILAVNSLDDSIDINNDDCFIKPTLTEDNRELIKSCKEANSLMKNKVELNITDDLFELPADTKKDWFTVDNTGALIFNSSAFSRYMDRLDKSYSLNDDKREFLTFHGDTVTVTGGDFGTAVNRTKLREDMEKALFDKSNSRVVVEFISRDNIEIGNSYIEVDLSNQMMWMYVDGQQVLGTPVITGMEDGEHNTPEGVYRLKSKSENTTIFENGEEKEVSFFMTINGENGICDASWKNLFGGVVYKEGGSEGSIYVLEDSAKTIYENSFENMPVICYYHDIVDSFFIEDSYMGQLMDLIANRPEIPTLDGEIETEETSEEVTSEGTSEVETGVNEGINSDDNSKIESQGEPQDTNEDLENVADENLPVDNVPIEDANESEPIDNQLSETPPAEGSVEVENP